MVSDKNDIQVRRIDQFLAAELAQPYDRKGSFLQAVPPQHHLPGVNEESVGQRADLALGLFRGGQIENIAQRDAHLVTVKVTVQPTMLILIIPAVSQVIEDLLGGFAAA